MAEKWTQHSPIYVSPAAHRAVKEQAKIEDRSMRVIVERWIMKGARTEGRDIPKWDGDADEQT